MGLFGGKKKERRPTLTNYGGPNELARTHLGRLLGDTREAHRRANDLVDAATMDLPFGYFPQGLYDFGQGIGSAGLNASEGNYEDATRNLMTSGVSLAGAGLATAGILKAAKAGKYLHDIDPMATAAPYENSILSPRGRPANIDHLQKGDWKEWLLPPSGAYPRGQWVTLTPEGKWFRMPPPRGGVH